MRSGDLYTDPNTTFVMLLCAVAETIGVALALESLEPRLPWRVEPLDFLKSVTRPSFGVVQHGHLFEKRNTQSTEALRQPQFLRRWLWGFGNRIRRRVRESPPGRRVQMR